MQKQKLAESKVEADEAERFSVALKNSSKADLLSYVNSCKRCNYQDEALNTINRITKFEALAQDERRAYFDARGDREKLRQYIASCKACDYVKDAQTDMSGLPAEFEKGQFALKVCNDDDETAYVVIATRLDQSSELWTSKGWFEVASKACIDLGIFAKPKFYYYAKAKGGSWEGPLKLCVTPGEAFTIQLNGLDCFDRSVAKGFYEVNVDASSTSHTVRLHP
jgi:uncharacterized membrane protein